jgi:Xaa-Pro aminopeptidase
MKADLDRLMAENSIDALLITGPAGHNPPMFYMTGGGHLTHADLIKPAGKEPVLFYFPMERDEAARTGLAVKNQYAYPYTEYLKASHGNRQKASAMMYRAMLEEVGVTSGRVSLYGRTEINEKFGVFLDLQDLMPDIDLIGEPPGNSVLLQAMATKDEDEIDRIRKMGRITTEVVAQVADFLSRQRARDGLLVGADGEPITIGMVKRKINLWLMERGAENPEGTIFAQGYDAGVPHSSGNPEAPLLLGKTIVFDIFPTEPGGGYFFDFTRTWCLGYASEDVEALYDDVRSTYETLLAELQVNTPGHLYQKRACELFEALGHATIRQDRNIQSGYVHSLGHGLGLNIHEAPWFRNAEFATNQDILYPGAVMTVEPGLYYPEKEMGCRLEDTVVVRPDGSIEILAEYPLDLIIPVQGG